MVSILFAAWCLMALSVAIHAGGVAGALRYLRRQSIESNARFWPATWLFVLVAAWMVFLHLLEIAVWGAFYAWIGAMVEITSALYFSTVTYTTTGYGDLVLPEQWRLVGGVEALTGILMSGWSTGFFIAVVNRLYDPVKTARI